ncbi:MAG: prepilin peptidase [SAR324 cluster bacterium]|nr:prepilin peptidase [SAR324 cluster bacterium]
MLIHIIASVTIGSMVSIILIRCIYRMPDDQQLWTPPLPCLSCNKALPWFTSVPLIGIFLSSRRCPVCQRALSFQPLWVNLSCILGTVMVVLLRHNLSLVVIDLVFIYALIVIAFIDYNCMIIEPRVVILAIAVRLIWLAWFQSHSLLHYISSMLIAAGAFYFIGFFYETLRRRQGLGDGDAAVIGLIGLWTGWETLSIAVLIAALSGILIGGSLLVLQKRSLATTRLPFAPFLCIGGGSVYFVQELAGISLTL